jgi:calreticulin
MKATMPDDWNEEMDGSWERPMIDNPGYKGPWEPNMIPNPAYKGPWVQPRIANPAYQVDKTVGMFVSGAIGFDLWQVKAGTIFDNIIVTDSKEEALKFGKETWEDYKVCDI